MLIKCTKCNTDMVGPYCPNCLKEKEITKDDDLFQMPDMDDIKAIREWKTALSKLSIQQRKQLFGENKMRYSIDDVKLQYFIDDASKSIDLLDDEIRHLQKKRSILAVERERAQMEMIKRQKEKQNNSKK